jgi:hydroxymethylpyrimidine pyrophosphatase-like HAD family hydrolase
MMAVADITVAVDNALPQVKAAATTTIGPNTADSVALHIASLISPDKIE